jgi:hypothetical protein
MDAYLPTPSELSCAKRREVKPTREFPRNRTTKSGFHSYCKPCHRNQFRESIARRHGGSTRHYHLMRRYGIGAEEVDELIRQQDGLCAVCGRREAKQVDHDHEPVSCAESFAFSAMRPWALFTMIPT